ncbi:MAG TPA: glycogen debranching protein [Lentisphaeria bacterium]|nr:MAG: hypothetical protein A2X47_08875 [Lentisphaerae bacterium GWF2_38_69]HBM15140.1 glycogen debranching protein [Lentisphaeria bacterium]
MVRLTQSPNTGEHKLYFRGDSILFRLTLDQHYDGRAFLRTNIGRASVKRKEIIHRVKDEKPLCGQDWYDIPMIPLNEKEYNIHLALVEVGHFEAITFFIPENETDAIWPIGGNVSVNVEPAEYCCANSIYCAFPRQFGPNKYYSKSKPINGFTIEEMSKYDKYNFTIIPPSGTFRDLIKELDFIIENLNCRIIHLLPINPTPTVFARMGRYGSPYASLDFTDIDPSLAEFDKKATPLEQFIELVDAIHKRNAKLIIDVAINHVGWAAKLHEEHPEWLLREADGKIISPGAWGVTWGDLTELNHIHPELWEYLAEMFLTWSSRGVDGFRCDAGYMIPYEAWLYIIAKVRNEYPDTIFLLEGLGGDPKITVDLLNRANMNWAYSELFQNYTKWQIQDYISKIAHKTSQSDGIMVHYAETHDNARLAATSNTYARMRTGLCALLSDNGGFGFTNGVEWFAKEKIDVHEASALNWGSRENQNAFIRRINAILISHKAFYRDSTIKFIASEKDSLLIFIRSSRLAKSKLLILINLDCKSSLLVDLSEFNLQELESDFLLDMISETPLGTYSVVNLKPGDVYCLCPNKDDFIKVKESEMKNILVPDGIELQRGRASALDLLRWRNETIVISGLDINGIETKYLNDPEHFTQSLFDKDEPVPMVHWTWPNDSSRSFIVPPNHLVIIKAPHRFRFTLGNDKKVLQYRGSHRCSNGEYFFIITPPKLKLNDHKKHKFTISVYGQGKTIRSTSEIIYLATDVHMLKTTLTNKEIRNFSGTFLDTNSRGGMSHIALEWNKINSKYEAFLAANPNSDVPVDRHIMLTRFRAWVQHQGRSVELNIDNLESFKLNVDGGGTWTFHAPVGNSLYVDISLAVIMHNYNNSVSLYLYRHPLLKASSYVSDQEQIHLIIRPDIEDRGFHADTKIDEDIRNKWENSVTCNIKSFIFKPVQERKLKIFTTKGVFKRASEFLYNIEHEVERDRGMQWTSDLYSPGFFHIDIFGGEESEIRSNFLTQEDNDEIETQIYINFKYLLEASDNSVNHLLPRTIKKYVVKRDALKTVIAGYPWFTDWGRDTLICVRGLLSAGFKDDVRKILLQFGKYEENGTLPNIIHGEIVGNRDTSDAQLWFFVGCSDYLKIAGDDSILSEKVNGEKTLFDALKSIAINYIDGTQNGIRVDADSMLVYSPPHFTWMDTNYPAGTPREGYPIEIQALWYFSLNFLSEIDCSGKHDWEVKARQVKDSIYKYFIIDYYNTIGQKTGRKYLSDCLHCDGFKPAAEAEADDHIRNNQLFAITLGALDGEIELSKSILDVSYDLLVPGAIRSLADRTVRFQLPVYDNNNKLLNDPFSPYCHYYSGNEDTQRKVAYHNGTAWTWTFPSYSEAYYKVYGHRGLAHAVSVLSSSSYLFNLGCLGHLPEIVDGSYPHKQKGCDAQAWGSTEFYRVWRMLHLE